MRRLIAVVVMVGVGVLGDRFEAGAEEAWPGPGAPFPPEAITPLMSKVIDHAKQGDAFFQATIASEYLMGLDVPKDVFAAMWWYRKAAEGGFAGAQFSLGWLYEEGRDVVPRDPAKAIYWYRRAAAQGDRESQYRLGQMNLDGLGMPRDVAAAYWLFNEAAEGDHADAQFALGRMYEDGVGVKRDMAHALAWYGRAAAQGHEEASERLKELGMTADPSAESVE